jgi:hypothetical protein
VSSVHRIWKTLAKPRGARLRERPTRKQNERIDRENFSLFDEFPVRKAHLMLIHELECERWFSA